MITITKREMSATKGSFLLDATLSGHVDAINAIDLDVGLGPLFLIVQEHLLRF